MRNLNLPKIFLKLLKHYDIIEILHFHKKKTHLTLEKKIYIYIYKRK